MKQLINKVLMIVLLGATLLAASCSNEVPDTNTASLNALYGDYAPLVISIEVYSTRGFSTLPYTDLSTVYAEFKGEKYYCGVPPTNSRMIQPEFYGLKAQNDYLLFGELDGATEYKDEQLIIHWGNTTIKSDTIVFSHTYDKNGKPTNDFWVNGIHVKHIEPGEAVTAEYGVTTEWAAGKGHLALYKDLEVLNNHNLNATGSIDFSDGLEGFDILNNNFQVKLLRTIISSSNKSFISSPLSVSFLLGMLANGAPTNSRTSEEIRYKLLCMRYPNEIAARPLEDFNYFFKTIIEQAPKCDPDVKISIANALFARKDFPLYSGYVNSIAETYHADYAQLDFTDSNALKTINNWSNTKTRGMVPQILGEINPNAVAYALNAIYFSAPWSMPFDKRNTQKGTFTRPDGTTTEVDMMYKMEMLTYFEDVSKQIVFLPLANGAFNFAIVLPTKDYSIASIIEQGYDLSLVLNLKDMQQYTKKTQVSLALPRFSIETSNSELKDQLKQLGVTSLFDPEEANLTEISPKPIYVSDMIQKARIRVDEAGCEAAATTATEISTGMHDFVTFRADHPFLYFITERSSGLIFFAGTYCGD
ncbi:MAG: serpin family protein [Bacteroidaceae bacterium]|nr:serpin family protein [Bacteroidaceae bacterium]MBQ9191212.1 serpin family protein [Bacteroidaceae bacterium]